MNGAVRRFGRIAFGGSVWLAVTAALFQALEQVLPPARPGPHGYASGGGSLVLAVPLVALGFWTARAITRRVFGTGSLIGGGSPGTGPRPG
jgi:hypothetical protein